MNSKLSFGLGFIFGSAISGAVVYMLMWKKQLKDNEELFKMLDQEEADLKARVAELEAVTDMSALGSADVKINPVNEYDSDDGARDENDISESDVKPMRIRRDVDSSQTTDYTQYYTDDDMEELLAEEEYPQEDAPPIDPYIISDSEYMYENPFYSKAHLTYYEGDDVLTDEHDEVIDDIYGNIGDSALHSFGSNPDDPDTIYVRNDNRSMDYEIIRMEGSYHEIVLGIYDKE